MPLDAICLAAVRKELVGRITGLRIEKIQQPERDTVILSLRGGLEPCKLLLSAGSGDARLHLTQHRFENPASPPMFCMLLRKHLSGARITDVRQPQSERVIDIVFSAPDALGELSEKRLTLELFGKVSNFILTGSDGIIIDCLRRIGGEMTDKRSVLPGLVYRPPPVQEGKLDPLSVSVERWQEVFDAAPERTADKWLLANFTSLSPLICRELSWRAYGNTEIMLGQITDGGESLSREFFMLCNLVKSGDFEPWLIIDGDERLRDFSFFQIMQYEGAMDVRRETGFSAMLDLFFTQSAQKHRVNQRMAATRKLVKTARDRISRKLIIQNEELKKSADRGSLRKRGDILLANMHLLKKGMSSLDAEDFFSGDGAAIRIDIDPLKTPQQNAAKYYKDYTKAKNAEKFLSQQVKRGLEEIEYLDSVLESIAYAEGERDLSEIRSELIGTGYIRAQKQEKVKESVPLLFESSAGIKIYAGKNNIQNEKLTHKTAAKSDIWLHTQRIHGAHVIISCGRDQPDDMTLYEAAVIAAYYSAARSAGKVPVDYTYVKHVKRQPGGRPGMVVYTDFKTIIASPDEKLVERLRQ